MKQLSVPNIDSEVMYNDIAKNKIKWDHVCSKCDIDNIHCDSCDEGNSGQMLFMKNDIFDRYKFYEDHKHDLNNIKEVNLLSDEQSDVLRTSYKNSKVFQKSREVILHNLPDKSKIRCPYCGLSMSYTLDHYFPESTYPEYILYVPNLIPCCSHCNSVKNNNLFKNNERMFLHFYYDPIPSYQFLKAKFSVENNIPTISFYLEFDEENEINNVIQRHFDELSLIEQYKESYNEILTEICNQAIVYLGQGNTLNEFKCILSELTELNKEKFGVNYYKNVIYDAVCNNADDLLKLIKQSYRD